MERCSRMVLCRTCHAFSLQKRDLMLNITLENPRMKLVDKIVFTTRDTVDCMTQASHHVRYLLCFVFLLATQACYRTDLGYRY